MKVEIESRWQQELSYEFAQKYFQELVENVKAEYAGGQVYPPGSLIFNAFNLCGFDDVRVVILGQDPYHGKGQANGLAFAVNNGVRLPPSLQNIFKELHADLGEPLRMNGDISDWAKQGVLLLNASLTVKEGQPNSHKDMGWGKFTDKVIEILANKKEKLVFVLWGAFAQAKSGLIDEKRHLIIKSPHPSPFSADRGFFGSKPFSKINQYLVDMGQEPIVWG